ncbi:MAG TPA: metallophosphoesterase [Egibacteraceae bacterium]|nr:metallophosphoesterase [Egibacteraceae bacterium]
MTPRARAARALALTAAAGLAWSAGVERRWYTVRHATVPVLEPTADRPLRVLHLSDIHQLPGQDHRLRFIRTAALANPDVVVVTGDLLESDEAIDDVVRTLSDVARGRTALAVLGSHDFWGPTAKNPLDYLIAPDRRVYGQRLDTDRLVDGLTAGGYAVMDNRRQAIKTPAGVVDVAGLGDPHIGLDRPDRVDWSPPAPDVVLQLGLVHAPYRRAVGVLAAHGAGLVLAGHTHGGQLRLPVAGALVNNCDLPLRQSRGLSRYGPAWLHVSAGLGHSTYAPVRFCCRPEATILDLVAKPLP